MLAIETVAVIGSGGDAHGCAILAALGGATVRLHHPAHDSLDRCFERLRFQVDLGVERGLLTRSDRQTILDGILVTPDLEEAVVGADLVADLDRDREGAEGGRRAGGGPPLLPVVELVRATAALAAPGAAAAEALAAAIAHPGRVLSVGIDGSRGYARVAVAAIAPTSRHVLDGAAAWADRINLRGGRAG